MKKIMLMGPAASGKTSLIQRLHGEPLTYIKTQAVQLEGAAIDTPGEYIENRKLMHALTVTAADADIIVFTQSATADFAAYSPGQASMFPCLVIGVVTKIDAAGEKQIRWAAELLWLAGVGKIFYVSNVDRTGIQELLDYLDDGASPD